MEANISGLDRSPLPFLHLIQALKHLPRTGWLRTVENPESVASHSFRLALLGLFAPDHMDRMKCMLLGLCHDLAESVVGDIPTYAGVPKERKHKLEHYGFRYIAELVRPCNGKLADDLMAAWVDYEEGRTPEARYMREMDKFECLIQAHEYEQRTYGEKDLDEFQGLSSKISSPEGMAWLDLLQQERSAHLSKRKRRLPVIFVLGDPDVCKTQCARLSEDLGFQHVSLEHVLVEKSTETSYRHSGLLTDCLKDEVDIPIDLVISLLESKIEEGIKERGWSLVCGFPKSIDQLLELERKVQKSNYTLLLNSHTLGNPQDLGSPGQSGGAIAGPGVCKAWSADFKNYLRLTEGYFREVDCNGPTMNVYSLVKSAVEGFIEHAKRAE